MIHDIFHGTARYANMIEDTADNNCIVRRIVMRETLARMRATPGHLRPGQQSVKELTIECFENLVEVISLPLRRINSFTASDLPNQMRFSRNIVTGNIPTIPDCMQRLDWLAVHLGQKDMCDRLYDALRRAFQQIGDADVYHAVAQANRAVHVREGIKLHPKFGDRSSRTKLAIRLLKQALEIFPQDATKLPCDAAGTLR